LKNCATIQRVENSIYVQLSEGILRYLGQTSWKYKYGKNTTVLPTLNWLCCPIQYFICCWLQQWQTHLLLLMLW